MDERLERLLSQAHLFDDPAAYEAGVLDAAEAFAEEVPDDRGRRGASMRWHPSNGGPQLRVVEDSVA